MSATVRKIAVIRLILLMLFIILIFFLILAFLDFESLRNHFWPFTDVQNGNHREVMTKCGNFFRTKGNKRQGRLYLVPYE